MGCGDFIETKKSHHVISLIDGFKLVDLMFDYNIGIQARETY